MAKKSGCKWFKVKDGKQTMIQQKNCDQKYINKLLDQGYSVSKLIEQGNKTKIITYSPMTRNEYLIQQRKKIYG